MIQAVLTNSQHPEYGVATVPFPIPREEYDHMMELLAPLEIGDAVVRDCRVDEISSEYPILKRLEKVAVNIDELDYLVKRLQSFDQNELAKYQGVAVTKGYFEMADLINLTFCCQDATVIRSFRSLEQIGRDRYMDLNGGMGLKEFSNDELRGEALRLILQEEGKVTPYGVIYENGMELTQDYDGKQFPEYRYEDCSMELAMSLGMPGEKESFLYLPMPDSTLHRVMQRSGYDELTEVSLRLMESALPEELDTALDMEHESLRSLNELCKVTFKLDAADMEKLGAVIQLTKPQNATEIQHLAEQLDLFDFVPGAQTPEDYGRHMIQSSGHYEYDDNLDGFYDYEKYGSERIVQEQGEFNSRGYISYKGFVSVQEILSGSQSERLSFQMGDMG
ncbi:MAG: hypothetical protein VB064_09000 [Oscillospiraceae bacterium]|nr:hypothetical protein [Oscillospiraceae bacterium]